MQKRSFISTRSNTRLTKRSQFLNLGSSGNRLVDNYLIFQWKKNNFCHLRFGITVAKHVSHSPGRNRIKRLIREILRLNLSSINIKKGVDFVIIAKKNSIILNYLQLEKRICTFLKYIQKRTKT